MINFSTGPTFSFTLQEMKVTDVSEKLENLKLNKDLTNAEQVAVIQARVLLDVLDRRLETIQTSEQTNREAEQSSQQQLATLQKEKVR